MTRALVDFLIAATASLIAPASRATIATSAPDAANRVLLRQKIIGGLPLGRFYPELADSVLLCATEMSRREDMDRLGEALA